MLPYVRQSCRRSDRVLTCFARSQEADGHQVVRSRGPFDGRFTFTSHETGDHSICLSTNYSSWFSSTHIRLYLDLTVGTTKPDLEHDRNHVTEVANRLRDLNNKLEDIRREQQYQREREADFRNLSETTNARAVWYTLAQIAVLVVTCAWQLRHLKVRIALLRPSLYMADRSLFLAEFLRR